ncbi:MAG: VWA domain-containing protein [Acidobacteriota bacterium]
MTRSSSLALTILAVGLVVGATAFAQKPAAKPNQTTPQERDDKIGVLDVRLPISAKNDKKFVSGLTVNNFEVYEDGKRQKIEKFVSPSQLPLNIALLIDTSNSVKLKLPFEKEAGESFISTVTTYRKKDKVLMASFDSAVELHQDFTDNQELLIRALMKLKAGGYTKLFDGVYRVVEEKMANLPDSEARRIIVILSDGEDTASEHTLRDAIEMAQRYDVTIFGISTKNFRGVDSGMVENADDKELRRLCEETGGQILLPSQKVELFRAFMQVALDLRQEYVLFYTPTNQAKAGKKREIKVKLVGADARLYHKHGYVY